MKDTKLYSPEELAQIALGNKEWHGDGHSLDWHDGYVAGMGFAIETMTTDYSKVDTCTEYDVVDLSNNKKGEEII